MHESLDSITAKSGLPPGTLVHVGERFSGESRITLFSCTGSMVEEQEVASVDEVLAKRQPGTLLWLHIEGLHNIPFVEEIGKRFDVHPLVLEDVLNTHQRPKYEEHPDYVLIVLKGMVPGASASDVHVEQISLLLFEGMLISFSEKPDDLFGAMRRRLHANPLRFGKLGVDYLAYALVDTIVDRYFFLQEAFDEAMEDLDEALLANPEPDTLARIHALKRAVIDVRRAMFPLREMLMTLQRSESPLVKAESKLYFRDVYDHVMHLTEVMESSREMIADMVGVYLSSLSNRMNEVMKVLTLFASIFIPLTFIAGIYGMNFEYMPELHYRWGYAAIWGVFIALPITLLLFFRKRRWL